MRRILQTVETATPQSGELAVDAVVPVVFATTALIEPGLLNELCGLAATQAVELTSQEFAQALAAIGAKHNYGLPPGNVSTASEREKFYRGLQLADLALAQACALGREKAWQQFIARFQGPLQQAAIAITGSSSLGEELASSLYGELYGLSEREDVRRSPLASYSGRGSLMGWLRTTLAQRRVDHHRRTWRESPLPEPDSGQEFAAPQTTTNDAVALTQLSRALADALTALPAEDRFVLSAYFLDQHTLLQIARLLRVSEATVSRKLKRLTTEVHKKVLRNLQAAGLSRRAAEEAFGVDPGDISLNLRSLLQSSAGETFSRQAATSTSKQT